MAAQPPVSFLIVSEGDDKLSPNYQVCQWADYSAFR